MKPVFEKDGVKIFVDDDPQNPRTEWDNIGTMVCFHGRYELGDKNHGYSSDDYSSWDEMKSAIIKTERPVVILPVYLMDHSGLSVSTSLFGCPWDSGQIGFIFAKRRAALDACGAKRVTGGLRKKAIGWLEGEIETYDKYLRGEVYGYEYGDDSCWGFYEEPEALADMVLRGEV